MAWAITGAEFGTPKTRLGVRGVRYVSLENVAGPQTNMEIHGPNMEIHDRSRDPITLFFGTLAVASAFVCWLSIPGKHQERVFVPIFSK